MYSIYQRHNEKRQIRLTFAEEISLAVCNNGVVPNALKANITEADKPPMGWILHIANDYNKQDKSVIIDIKPSNNEVFLCELDTVFGYSYPEWTPIMYQLNRLYSNISPDKFDKQSFVYPKNPEIIYTVIYLAGSFRNGQLTGTWSPPFGSITALLYWPGAMTFFHRQVKHYDPNFLTEKIYIIE